MVGRWGVVVAWAGVAAGAQAQDVIYSRPGPGGTYQRYEQYGFGKDARVRLRSATAAGVPTRRVVVDPWTGLAMPVYGEAIVEEEHERAGPAPAFGTFGGRLVNSRGPDPAGLYRGLGPGTSGRGRIATTLPPGAIEAPGALVEPPAGADVRVEGAVGTGALPAPVPVPPAPGLMEPAAVPAPPAPRPTGG